MPIVCEELHQSRELTEAKEGFQEIRRFKISGTNSPAEARNFGPQYEEDHPEIDDIKVTQRKFLVLSVSDQVLQLEVTYSKGDLTTPPPNENEDEFELSTMSQSQHIVRAITQTNYPSAADIGTLIGVNDDEVEGVDIQVPAGTYTIAKNKASLTQNYIRTLYQLSGTVNASPFKNFAAGEALFMGARARRRGGFPWRVEYHFALSANTNETIDSIAGSLTFQKDGWDYLWFKQVKKEESGAIKHLVGSAHVARVYRRTDFSKLGVGT